MLVYKIRKACIPPKMRFLERRYGPEIDREMEFMKIKIEQNLNIEDLKKGKPEINPAFSF
jgi:hypothetical protein